MYQYMFYNALFYNALLGIARKCKNAPMQHTSVYLRVDLSCCTRVHFDSTCGSFCCNVVTISGLLFRSHCAVMCAFRAAISFTLCVAVCFQGCYLAGRDHIIEFTGYLIGMGMGVGLAMVSHRARVTSSNAA